MNAIPALYQPSLGRFPSEALRSRFPSSPWPSAILRVLRVKHPMHDCSVDPGRRTRPLRPDRAAMRNLLRFHTENTEHNEGPRRRLRMLLGPARTERVIGLAIEVHRNLGPGLLESVYEAALCFELAEAAIPFERQVPIPAVYRGQHIDPGFRADLVIERSTLVEIKSVASLVPLHDAQVLTYLRMARLRVGLLLNFNVLRLKDGLRRLVL